MSEEIKHPLRGDDPLLVIRFKDPEVEFMARRLSSVVELRYQIDHGKYPLNWWHGTPQANADNTITELTPLNIKPVKEAINPITHHQQLGLRWLVCDTILETAKWLTDHGYSNYADAVLRWDKERQNNI